MKCLYVDQETIITDIQNVGFSPVSSTVVSFINKILILSVVFYGFERHCP
jgi:hypothetical protein